MLSSQRLIDFMTVGSWLVCTLPTLAQSPTNPSALFDKEFSEVYFQPPSNDKKPEDTADAGSRQSISCLQNLNPTTLMNVSSEQKILIPLIPRTNLGLTVSERPKLWIYVPNTSAQQIILSIREEGKVHHSRTIVPIQGGSGIVSLQPHQNSLPLKMDKDYKLSVVLVCGKNPGPNDPALDVWVRRVKSPNSFEQESILKQAAWYGREGIWYDSLDSLMQARKFQPQNQDLQNIWSKFLESEGLEKIATEPVHF